MTISPEERRAARVAILDFVDTLARQKGASVSMAADTVASLAAIGALPKHIQALVTISNERPNARRSVSRSSILSWHRARAQEKL